MITEYRKFTRWPLSPFRLIKLWYRPEVVGPLPVVLPTFLKVLADLEPDPAIEYI